MPDVAVAEELVRGDPRAERVVVSVKDGTPLDVALLEEHLGDEKRRARVGKMLMLGSLVPLAIGGVLALTGVVPERLMQPVFGLLFAAAFAAGSGGLTMWYRTQ